VALLEEQVARLLAATPSASHSGASPLRQAPSATLSQSGRRRSAFDLVLAQI
jgi:hypothetical protein